jgi:hypothetical protein
MDVLSIDSRSHEREEESSKRILTLSNAWRDVGSQSEQMKALYTSAYEDSTCLADGKVIGS